VILTGIYLMQTGCIEANLVRLNEVFHLPYIPDLVARKLAGVEHSVLSEVDISFHQSEYLRLLGVLEEAAAASRLPDAPAGRGALNDLLLRVRLKTTGQSPDG
jgi:hypothetical protein